MMLHEISPHQSVEQGAKFIFQLQKVDGRCAAACETRYLAIHASPVAGIARVEIDPDGDASGAAGNYRVDVGHAAAVTAVVGGVKQGVACRDGIGGFHGGRPKTGIIIRADLATVAGISIESSPMQITRRLEFDAGHRIPDHQSQCRHLHGHRYVIEITLRGSVIQASGDPANGMVMDFSEVKSLACQHLVDAWDHAFLAFRGDTPIVDFLATLPGHKTVLLDVVPTAENLAALAFSTLDRVYLDRYGNQLRLERVRIFETPNCWADALREECAGAPSMT